MENQGWVVLGVVVVAIILVLRRYSFRPNRWTDAAAQKSRSWVLRQIRRRPRRARHSRHRSTRRRGEKLMRA